METLRSVAEHFWGGACPRWPTEVYLEVTNSCNLRCAMCAAFSAVSSRRHQSPPGGRGFLDLQEFAPALKSVLKHALCVHCFGFGEPTLHPRFRDIIDFVAEHEVMIDFVTNGTRLDKSLAEFLVSRNVFEVTFSFSGSTAEDYEAIYRGSRFETVIQNIQGLALARKAAGAKWPRIRVHSLAFEHHIASLDRFVELMGKSGVDTITLDPVVIENEVLHLAHHVAIYQPSRHDAVLKRAKTIASRHGVSLNTKIWRSQKAQNEADVQQMRAERVSPRVSVETLSRERKIPLSEMAGLGQGPAMAAGSRPVKAESPRPDASEGAAMACRADSAQAVIKELQLAGAQAPFKCPLPFSTMYFDVHGRVRPCCWSDATPALGDIGTNSADEIWRAHRYSLLRSALVNGRYPRQCRTCINLKGRPQNPVQPAHALSYAGWLRGVYGRRISTGVLGRIWARYALMRLGVSADTRAMARLLREAERADTDG